MASADCPTKKKKTLLIYAQYDLTFPLQFSLEVKRSFAEHGYDFESRLLPCGHYTTGETPYKYIDGWVFWDRLFIARLNSCASLRVARTCGADCGLRQFRLYFIGAIKIECRIKETSLYFRISQLISRYSLYVYEPSPHLSNSL